jgi:hypothetical protein
MSGAHHLQFGPFRLALGDERLWRGSARSWGWFGYAMQSGDPLADRLSGAKCQWISREFSKVWRA